MSDARNLILERIRKSTGKAPYERVGEYASIRRDYQIAGKLNSAQRLDLFAHRLRDYGCGVYDCAETGIAEAVAKILGERKKQLLLVPAELNALWLPEAFEFVQDRELAITSLDAAQGVVTGCAVAIAVTGSIILRHTPGEGRRALTLIPDYHLCIVFEEQVVETVPQAIRYMRRFERVPLTTISGPSATSDIEMTRVKGVHGPRTLEVILVRSNANVPGASLQT